MTHPWKEELNKLLLQGASYADVRYTPREDSAALVMRNGNLLAFSAGGERGCMERLHGLLTVSQERDVCDRRDRRSLRLQPFNR